MNDLLREGCEQMGVVLETAQLDALGAYAQALQKWNKRYNFVSRRDIDRLLPRHLLDSLSGLPWIAQGPVLDVGTGPGLPGMVLAITRPGVRFVLCDRSARRIRFVQQMVHTLGLENVETRCADVERLSGGGFQTVVARAVAAPDTLFAQVRHLLSERGWLLVYAATGRHSAQLATSRDQALTRYHEVVIPGLSEPHQLVQRFVSVE